MRTYHIRRRLCGLGLCFVTLLLGAGPVPAEGQETLGWVEAINQALDANQSLAAAQEDLEASHKNVAIARGDLLPSLGVLGVLSESESATFSQTSGVIPSTTGMVGATVSQMIYNQRSFANHNIQKDLYASQEDQLRNTRFGIISAAGQAYIGVLLAQDMLLVQTENRNLTEQNLQVARDRERVGSTDLKEVLRWQSQLYGNEQALVGQQSSVVVNRIALNQVRDRPAEEVYTLEKLTVEKNGFIFSSDVVVEAISREDRGRLIRDYLVDLGLENSPLLTSLDREIAAQERQLRSNRRWLIPSLNLSAGADAFVLTSGDGEDLAEEGKGFWKVGVSLKWPIFDGGSNFARVHQAVSQVRSLESQRRELESSLEQGIRSTVEVAMADYRKIGLARAQAETAEQSYQLVYDAYLVGEVSLLDLLDAQSQKVSANASATTAFYTFLADLLSAQQSIGYFSFLEPRDEVENRIRELEQRLQPR